MHSIILVWTIFDAFLSMWTLEHWLFWYCVILVVLYLSFTSPVLNVCSCFCFLVILVYSFSFFLFSCFHRSAFFHLFIHPFIYSLLVILSTPFLVCDTLFYLFVWFLFIFFFFIIFLLAASGFDSPPYYYYYLLFLSVICCILCYHYLSLPLPLPLFSSLLLKIYHFYSYCFWCNFEL